MLFFYFKTIFIKKKNFIFKTSRGKVFHFNVDYGTTVKELLKKFFDRIGRPDLMGCKDIIFIFKQIYLNVIILR